MRTCLHGAVSQAVFTRDKSAGAVIMLLTRRGAAPLPPPLGNWWGERGDFLPICVRGGCFNLIPLKC